MLDKVLFVFHILLFIYQLTGWYFLPSKYIMISFIINTSIMYSWLVFDGCVLNDIEKAVSSENVSSGSLTMRLAETLGVNAEKHKKTITTIVDILLLSTYMIYAYKAKKTKVGALLLIVYIILNGGTEGKGWRYSKSV